MAQRTTVAAGVWPKRVSRALLLGLGLVVFAACTPIHEVSHSPDAATATDPSAVTTDSDSCSQDRDCAKPNPCIAATCERNRCVVRLLEEGSELEEGQQVQGDCNQLVCDGSGQWYKRPDDSDTPTERNPCQAVSCDGGQQTVRNVADGMTCNTTGTCSAGECSACVERQECSGSDQCTVHRWTCGQNGPSCDDTGEPRPSQSCGQDKVCSEGSCVPCVLGSECMPTKPCHVGQVIACNDGVECLEMPVSGGPSCGKDSAGNALYCMNGTCAACSGNDTCAPASDPCQVNRLDCSSGGTAKCMLVPREDGASCNDGRTCHGGVCTGSTLINGDFSRGLNGWTPTGDAMSFRVAPDQGNANRIALSTAPDGRSSGGATQGTLTQRFVVPADALALRFVISGGHAHVRLKNMGGAVVQDCVGVDSNDVRIMASWDLVALRGQELVLSIEDDLTSGDWAYVTVSGFDVIRDIAAPLRNPQFLRDLADWETTGDGQRFHVFETYNHFDGLMGAAMYGMRRCISTYARDMNAEMVGDDTRGTISQRFEVPSDAVALRFAVHGGSTARVALLYDAQALYTISGRDSDSQAVLAEWDLRPHRGKQVRLTVEDDTNVLAYGHIGTTGFDLITSYNGP